jgi:acyl carrier protein
MNERLFIIFTTIFPSAKGKKASDLSSAKLHGWDSLGHLKLIMAIEKEFKIRFDTSEIPALTSFELIDQALKGNR